VGVMLAPDARRTRVAALRHLGQPDARRTREAASPPGTAGRAASTREAALRHLGRRHNADHLDLVDQRLRHCLVRRHP
jgi:hypothetical protein